MDLSVLNGAALGAFVGGAVGIIPGLLLDETKLDETISKVTGPCGAFLTTVFFAAVMGAGLGATHANNKDVTTVSTTQVNDSRSSLNPR